MAGPVYNCVWLFFCTLYPAYASFKAVKTKNVKEYVSLKCLLKVIYRDSIKIFLGEVYDVLDCVCLVFCSGESVGPIWKYFLSILHRDQDSDSPLSVTPSDTRLRSGVQEVDSSSAMQQGAGD